MSHNETGYSRYDTRRLPPNLGTRQVICHIYRRFLSPSHLPKIWSIRKLETQISSDFFVLKWPSSEEMEFSKISTSSGRTKSQNGYGERPGG